MSVPTRAIPPAGPAAGAGRPPSRGAAVLACACLALLFAACGRGGAATPIEEAEDTRLVDAEVLLQALAGEDPQARERAALAMGRIQDAGYAEPLAAATVPSAPADVRRAAVFALGQLGLAAGARPSPPAIEACRAAAADADPEIVALALEALGKQADPAVAPLLVEELRHADAGVRVAAAHALFRLRFVPVWRGEADTAPALPDDAVLGLIGALSDPEAGVRGAAAHAFARHPEPRALDALTGALTDDDEWVRLFALRAVGGIGDPAAGPALARATADDNPRIRTAAVDALAAVGAAGLLPPATLFDTSFHVRAAVARAWGTVDDEATAEFLARLGSDPSPTVRAAAIGSQARRLGDAFVAGLDFHMKDAAWPIRAAAARATASLPERGLEYARRALADPDIRVRTAALEAMAGRPGADDAILEALEAEDLALRGTAVGMVAASGLPHKSSILTRAYEQSAGEAWIEVRESIVDAAAGVDPAAPLVARAATTDPAASVRAKARAALANAGAALPEARPATIAPSPLLGRHVAEDPLVVLETSHGEIEIRCNAGGAPVHVANFVQRVREGFYDGLVWHRVVSNFVVQGGDPRGDGWGSGDVVLRDEIDRTRFTRGTVGMPKSGKDTGGCQLFITHVPTPHLDGNYTVFGQVVRGMDAVDAIEVGDTIQRAYVASPSP